MTPTSLPKRLGPLEYIHVRGESNQRLCVLGNFCPSLKTKENIFCSQNISLFHDRAGYRQEHRRPIYLYIICIYIWYVFRLTIFVECAVQVALCSVKILHFVYVCLQVPLASSLYVEARPCLELYHDFQPYGRFDESNPYSWIKRAMFELDRSR